jgi:hypothetical protein
MMKVRIEGATLYRVRLTNRRLTLPAVRRAKFASGMVGNRLRVEGDGVRQPKGNLSDAG